MKNMDINLCIFRATSWWIAPFLFGRGEESVYFSNLFFESMEELESVASCRDMSSTVYQHHGYTLRKIELEQRQQRIVHYE